MRLRSSVEPKHFGLQRHAGLVRRHGRRSLSSSWDGFTNSHKLLGRGYYDSILNRDLYTHLTADPRIKAFAVEPHRLTYWAPDADGVDQKHSYVPDGVARTSEGEILVFEAKARFFAEQDKWRRLEPSIREAYAEDHGATFLIFTEEQIRQQPRLSNLQIMVAHRGPPFDDEAEIALRRAADVGGEHSTVGHLCEMVGELGVDDHRAFSAVMRLALKGEIKLDLSVPLASATAITRLVH